MHSLREVPASNLHNMAEEAVELKARGEATAEQLMQEMKAQQEQARQQDAALLAERQRIAQEAAATAHEALSLAQLLKEQSEVDPAKSSASTTPADPDAAVENPGLAANQPVTNSETQVGAAEDKQPAQQPAEVKSPCRWWLPAKQAPKIQLCQKQRRNLRLR